MKEVETIQTLLEKRAERKLEKDLRKYLDNFRQDDFFTVIKRVSSPLPGVDLGDYLCYSKTGYAYDIIFKELLPKYIKAESKDFLEKVENLQSELDELRDSIPNQ